MLNISKSTVKVDDRWLPYRRDLGGAVNRALLQASAVVAQEARSAPSPSHYNIEGIQQKTRPELVVREYRGKPEVWVVNPDFRAVFFEKGTYEKRGGKLRASTVRRRQTASGQARLGRAGANSGVAPQRFLRRGLRAGRVALVALLQRELDRVA